MNIFSFGNNIFVDTNSKNKIKKFWGTSENAVRNQISTMSMNDSVLVNQVYLIFNRPLF